MDEFNDEMAQAKNKVAVIYFYAPYGKENKRVDAVLDQLTEKYGSKLLVLSVNIDESHELFNLVRGSKFPTYMFYKNLKHVEQFSGADVEKLKQTITKLIN